jgi:hypothetical protein
MFASNHEQDANKSAAASNAIAANAPRAMPPSVTFGATTVNGRLHPSRIQKIVHAHRADFLRCYEKGLATHPQLEGRVSMRIVIGKAGAVIYVSDGGSTLPDSEVAACFRSVFSEMCFPRPEGGIVTVVYPIALDPGHAL